MKLSALAMSVGGYSVQEEHIWELCSETIQRLGLAGSGNSVRQKISWFVFEDTSWQSCIVALDLFTQQDIWGWRSMQIEESSHDQFTRSLRRKKTNLRLALLCTCPIWKYTKRYICAICPCKLNLYEHHGELS